MSRLSKMSRLLVAAVALGALTQTASLTYYLSVESADAAMIVPIDLTVPERRNEAARFVLIHAIAEQYGITVADRTAQWQLDEVSSLKSSLDQITNRLSELTGRDARRLMTDLFGGVAFYRDCNWRGSIAYTIGAQSASMMPGRAMTQPAGPFISLTNWDTCWMRAIRHCTCF